MDRVKIYIDPRCPWCYQAVRWLTRLESAGRIELEFGLYCVEMANLGDGGDPVLLGEHGDSAMALRVAWVVRERAGSPAVGRFYRAFGSRLWDVRPPITSLEVAIREAVIEAGFTDSLVDEAMTDPATWVAIMEEHAFVVREKGGLGVPTLVIDGGRAVFGPVISQVPVDDEAVDLWNRIAWLGRYENFFEIKLHRASSPELVGGQEAHALR